MSQFVKVASVSELSTGEGKVVDAEGQSIALFNVDGTFSAIDNTCTHVGGPLGDGRKHGGYGIIDPSGIVQLLSRSDPPWFEHR